MPVPALDTALETFTNGCADNGNIFTGTEHIRLQLLSKLVTGIIRGLEFLDRPQRRCFDLLEKAEARLGALGFFDLIKTQNDLGRFFFQPYHIARADFKGCHRDHVTLFVEDLGHANFFS